MICVTSWGTCMSFDVDINRKSRKAACMHGWSTVILAACQIGHDFDFKLTFKSDIKPGRTNYQKLPTNYRQLPTNTIYSQQKRNPEALTKYPRVLFANEYQHPRWTNSNGYTGVWLLTVCEMILHSVFYEWRHLGHVSWKMTALKYRLYNYSVL